MPKPLAPTTTALGANLRAARLEAGWNHRELAEMTGANQTTYSDVETGRITNPGVYTLYKLAVVLGVRLEDLMGVPRVEATTKGRSRARRR